MRRTLIVLTVGLLLVPFAQARKPHSVKLGKTSTVKLFLGPAEDRVVDITIRPLMVDGEIREFTTGDLHDITDDLFAVQRVFRLNDKLPADPKQPPQWKWQKGGWLLVDRDSGRVTRLALPLFDPYYSAASWYRDYVAYCGVSGDGEMLYAVIVQVPEKKPLLERELRHAKGGDDPASECAPPEWQRQPPRVTFLPTAMQKITFEVKGRTADPAAPAQEVAPEQPASAQPSQAAGGQPK